MTILKIEQDENGELILPLEDNLSKSLNWKIGDTIIWIDNGDGSYTLTKKKEEIIKK